jgi:hypothetical protein
MVYVRRAKEKYMLFFNKENVLSEGISSAL